MRALLIFLDGVGVGADAEYNAFTIAKLPNFRMLLGGAVPTGRNVSPLHAERATLLALDATLGVEGTPQSGTGQATLLTGRDAVALHGRHFGPWVPAKLRPMLRDESVLARAVRAGKAVTFANAYPEEMIRLADDVEARQPAFMRAGPPVAAAGAGILTRNATDLLNGNAVASEIVNDGWRKRLGYMNLPETTAREAGERLARIAGKYDLTFFAHYATDSAGHSQEMSAAVEALERVDEFLGGVVEALADDCVVFIASDHGNIEDIRVGHTRNPALGLVIGNGHARIAERATSLLDVTPMILECIGVA